MNRVAVPGNDVELFWGFAGLLIKDADQCAIHEGYRAFTSQGALNKKWPFNMIQIESIQDRDELSSRG